MKSLILGGVKSGKSRYAETYIKDFVVANSLEDSRACYIATAEGLDSGMQQRIEDHKQQRPESWQLIEEPIHLADALKHAEETSDIILIDCLTLWLTNLIMKEDEGFLETSIAQFLLAVSECSKELVCVSNETNMGIMPLGNVTREYCDRAGRLHQLLAEKCESVSLVVAGLPLSLKSPNATVL